MRKRLLWVDDEIEFLRSHVQFLESRGYDVVTAHSGDAAIRLIRENGGAFDIVLLDKQMPVKSGAAALEEIKALRPDLPVIMVTGYQHSADAAIRARIDGYIAKPVDPAMILVECKRIIDSRQQTAGKTADRYLRGYTENMGKLSGKLGAAELMTLCHSIAKWDVELEGVNSEGVRQAHAGLKSDAGKKFCDCVVQNYTSWASGAPGRPMMSVDLMPKFIAPELRLGRGVFVVVLSGMRLDQFLAVEPELKGNFSVSGAKFLSLLPTASDICMAPLVSGLYPDELHGLEPKIFKAGADTRNPAVLARAMSLGLERMDSVCGEEPAAPRRKGRQARADKELYDNSSLAGVKTAAVGLGADITEGRKAVMPLINEMKAERMYAAVTLDIMEFVINSDHAIMSLPESARRDDAALRMLVRSKFVNSPIVEMMRAACGAGGTVILTSDHGHVFSGKPAEIYEASKVGSGLRSMFVKKAEADDRAVFLASDLPLFRLPPYPPGTKCLLARENFYFTLAEKFGGRKRANIGAFRCGGVSPEEMVLPAYVCRPK